MSRPLLVKLLDDGGIAFRHLSGGRQRRIVSADLDGGVELMADKPNMCWSGDIERHEALSDRAVVKGHRCWPVAAGRLKLRAA